MKRLNRRDFLRMAGLGSVGALAAACGAQPTPETIVETVIVEKEGEKVVETVVVEKEVEKEVVVTATPPPTEAYSGKIVVMASDDASRRTPAIEAVETAFPNIELEWRNLTSEKYVELFAAAEVAGDQIDLMHLNGQDLRRYAVAGKLKDLSDLSYLDRFRPVGLQTYTVADKLWALPVGGIDGFPYLYNKKSFEAIGVTEEIETYEQLKELAPELQQAGIAPVVHQGQNIYMWPVYDFWAFGQTSGNQPVELTWKTLAGEMKFTDPEHVAALAALHDYAQDGMFSDGVNSLDGDSAWSAFATGKAAIYYEHSWRIGFMQENGADFPDLEMSLMPPLRHVGDDSILRQLPGGTGNAYGIYANIAPEREEIAFQILEVMSSDQVVKQLNEQEGAAVSTNANVEASDTPLAVKYAEECAPNQFVYLDWYWPPEITRAFQEEQQAIVAGVQTPDGAAQTIQDVLDDLYADGYEFVS